MERGALGRRTVRRAGASLLVMLLWLTAIVGVGTVRAAGPPFPAPVEGQRVYDTAGIWTAEAIASAESTIRKWADRTGTQAVVYSQVVPDGTDDATARSQAAALGNQWQVGRAGFDDGLVVLFDIYPSGVHGKVAIVSGDGFRSTYLSDSDAQAIIDDDILPLLQGGSPDFDGAMLAGLRAIDASITPEHAAQLQQARIVNAAIGLVLAPIVAIALIVWPFFHWVRYGRDPHYLDDPSILMPAPPDGLTAAAGALVFDGQSSRRTLTTAMLDLASRGRIAFVDRSHVLSKKVAVVVDPASPQDPVAQAHQKLADRRPLSDAERFAERELKGHADQGLVEDKDLLAFGKETGTFDDKLEDYAVTQGWFAQGPKRVRNKWWGLGTLELLLAGGALFVALNATISGLTLLAVALAAGGIATFAIGYVMPARTLAGATIRAMLAAYRRTLQATMAQARSMTDVVKNAGLAWIETPDQALVWGTALGLQHDVEAVLERSRDDLQAGRTTQSAVWFPGWWYTGDGGQVGGWGSGGGGSSFSGSAIPNIGGMMAALGTIGNAPSSSGGGGGGFSGGGGFGGGASGGF
jgi:uncharacterized membrane protein YgcG